MGSASAVGAEVATATTAAESTTAAPPPAIAESALPAPAEVSNPLSGLMAGYADSDEEEEPATGGEVQADSKVDNFLAELEGAGLTNAVAQWEQCLDPGTNAYYFWNMHTNEVRWTPPEGWEAKDAAAADAATAESAAEGTPADAAAAATPEPEATVADGSARPAAVAEASAAAGGSDDVASGAVGGGDGGCGDAAEVAPSAEEMLEQAEEQAREQERAQQIGAAFVEFAARLAKLAGEGGAAAAAAAAAAAGGGGRGGGSVLRLQIELETRREDWEAGALGSAYLWERLQACSLTLQQLEAEGLPEGWTRAWDSGSAAYYYAHPESGEATWEEPLPPPPPEPLPPSAPAAPAAAEEMRAGGVKAREERTRLKEARRRREAGLPPLTEEEAVAEAAAVYASSKAGRETAERTKSGGSGSGSGSAPQPRSREAGVGGASEAGEEEGEVTEPSPPPAADAAADADADADDANAPNATAGAAVQLSEADLEWARRTSAKAAMHPARLAALQQASATSTAEPAAAAAEAPVPADPAGVIVPAKPRTKLQGTSKPSGSDVRAKKKLVRPHAHPHRRPLPPTHPTPPTPPGANATGGATRTAEQRGANVVIAAGQAGRAAPLRIALSSPRYGASPRPPSPPPACGRPERPERPAPARSRRVATSPFGCARGPSCRHRTAHCALRTAHALETLGGCADRPMSLRVRGCAVRWRLPRRDRR